jgi:hypothetical protein
MPKDLKKTFVLRLDAKTYALVEKWAADEFRSVNGQLEFLIHRALRDSGRLKQNRPEDPASDEKTSP